MKWFWILAALVVVAHSLDVHQLTEREAHAKAPIRITKLGGPVFKAVAYERATQTLRLLFVSGYEYQYEAVPAQHYQGLIRDHGRAAYYQRHIRGRYQARRVDAD